MNKNDINKRTKSRCTGTNKSQKHSKRFDRSDKESIGQNMQDNKFTGKTNDWGWYALNESMAKDVANIPFNTIPGVKVDLWRGEVVPENTQHWFGSLRLPAISVIYYIPGPGSSWDGTSGVNMAARQLYTAIRQKNSGAKNYEAPDLMMYLLSMESIYLQYFELRRMLGLARTYYFANRNMPDVLLNAAGALGGDIRGNFANYRARLNLLRERINSMAIPSGFSSFKRRALIASNVFMDSDSLRGNAYILVSSGAYKFNATKYESGGCCEWTPVASSMTFEARLNLLDECITTVLTDDDMNLMSGDIVKAFGEGGLYTLPDTPSDFVVNPAFDSNVLAQIENLRMFNVSGEKTVLPGEALDIWQANNVLYWRPFAKGLSADDATPTFQLNVQHISNQWASEYAYFINSHVNNPQAVDVLEWTRLTAAAVDRSKIPHLPAPYFPIACGLELVNAIGFLSTADGSGDSVSEMIGWQQFDTNRGPNVASVVMQFDWHPMSVDVYMDNPPDTTIGKRSAKYSGPGMDLKVYTIISRETIARMHETANYCVYYLR